MILLYFGIILLVHVQLKCLLLDGLVTKPYDTIANTTAFIGMN